MAGTSTFETFLKHEDGALEFYGTPCDIEVRDWPYECIAKDRHPDHTVYWCREHRVWWHLAPEQAS